MRPELRKYFELEAMNSFTNPSSSTDTSLSDGIETSLERLLLLVDSIRKQKPALEEDFAQESITISKDLYRTLLAYNELLNPESLP